MVSGQYWNQTRWLYVPYLICPFYQWFSYCCKKPGPRGKSWNSNISMLLYMDDIVLISPTAENLQQMLNEVSKCCLKCGLRINPSKTQVMHVRNHQRPRTSEHKLSITDSYKYLGYLLHEHLNNTRHVEVMPGSASRSFGRIYNMFKTIKNMCYINLI